MQSSFISGFNRTFGVQLFIMLLMVAQSIIVNRTLIPEDKGVYAIIIQTINIAVAFFQFGQPEVMLHYLTLKKGNLNSYFINLSLISITSLIFSFFIIYISFDSFKIIDKLAYIKFLPLVFSLIISLNLLNIFYQRIIHLTDNLNYYNIIILIEKIMGLLFFIITLFIIENKIIALIIGILFSLFFSSLLSIFILFRKIKIKIIKPNFILIKNSLIDGFKIQFGMMAAILGAQMGIFIVNEQIGNEAAGIYSVSLGLANMFLIIPNSIKIVFQSKIQNYFELYNSIKSQTLIIFKQSVIILFIICILCFVFGEDIIFLLYGKLYIPSYGPFLILLFYFYFRGLGSCFGSFFGVEKKFWFSSKAVIITVLVNLILSFSLSEVYGIYGIAFATSFAWFVWLILMINKYLKMTNDGFKSLILSSEDFRISLALIKSIIKIK